MEHIANAIRAKIKSIIGTNKLFSVLSDGSQARKTGSEKELEFSRVLREWKPEFFCVALQNIDYYGDANASNLKHSIDDAFLSDKLNLAPEIYAKHLISATADGASVNMGIYGGLIKKLSEERPWLIGIHCVNHRMELAVKEGLGKDFIAIKDFMTLLFNMCKQSGKFVRHFHSTAESLEGTWHTFYQPPVKRFRSPPQELGNLGTVL